MGRPGARTVAIRDQILAALRAQWPSPISTRRVCELLHATRYDETGLRIYPQLCALDRMGLVERIRREPDCRDVFWRFLGDPTDDDLNAVVDAMESPAPGMLAAATVGRRAVAVVTPTSNAGRGDDTLRELPRAGKAADLMDVIASLRAAAIATADAAVAEAEAYRAATESHLAAMKSMRAVIVSYDRALMALADPT